MVFYRKRPGRPRSNRSKVDQGTLELRRKYAAGHTKEPFDLCLEQGVMRESEHEAGLRFRWLYTLQFGAPDISAADIEGVSGKILRTPRDEAWLTSRNEEYGAAIEALRACGACKVIMNLCLFHYRPLFLRCEAKELAHMPRLERSRVLSEQRLVREGMAALAEALGFTEKPTGTEDRAQVVGFTEFVVRV